MAGCRPPLASPPLSLGFASKETGGKERSREPLNSPESLRAPGSRSSAPGGLACGPGRAEPSIAGCRALVGPAIRSIDSSIDLPGPAAPESGSFPPGDPYRVSSAAWRIRIRTGVIPLHVAFRPFRYKGRRQGFAASMNPEIIFLRPCGQRNLPRQRRGTLKKFL